MPLHSRREFMFIENAKQFYPNPEEILCFKYRFLHKIPSGLAEIAWKLL
jgi:acetate kinase